jgi:hypothetical protein
MKSRNVICSPQALTYLKDRKEFRIVPAPIWRHVQMNDQLSIESRFLWGVLWELCALEKDYERRLTWGFLSKRLGKSESSIRRWARQLQADGYLQVTQVFNKDGGQLPSVFRIGVPNGIAQEIAMNSPDRRVKVIEPETSDTESADQIPACVEPDELGSASSQEDRREDNGSIMNAEIESSAPTSNDHVSDCGAKQREEVQAPEFRSAGGVHAEITDSDSNAPAYRAESQTACMKIGAENGTSRLQSILSKDRSRGGKGSGSSHNARSEEKRLDVQGQPGSSYEREIEEIRKRALKLEKEGQKRAGEGAFKVELPQGFKSGTQNKDSSEQVNNNNTPANVDRTMLRVKGELQNKIGIGGQIDKLAKEFTFAILFGAFKKMEFAKAINVGVKLVREGRWQSPRYSIDGQTVCVLNG